MAYKFRLVSAATTNATFIGAAVGETPRKVVGLHICNAAASPRTVKFYDKASAPTPGTDPVFWTFQVPALNLFRDMNIDLRFFAGIAFATTLEIQDGTNTAVAANDLVVQILFE